MKDRGFKITVVILIIVVIIAISSTVKADKTIGSWQGKVIYIGIFETVQIFKSDSQFYAISKLSDGKNESTRKIILIPTNYLGKTRYVHKGSESDTGDYYEIDQFGNLLLGDNMGVINTYYPKGK